MPCRHPLLYKANVRPLSLFFFIRFLGLLICQNHLGSVISHTGLLLSSPSLFLHLSGCDKSLSIYKYINKKVYYQNVSIVELVIKLCLFCAWKHCRHRVLSQHAPIVPHSPAWVFHHCSFFFFFTHSHVNIYYALPILH